MILWAPGEPDTGKSINVSATAKEPWNRLSQEYQHGQIPVPGMKGMYSECVMGIMEGLKLIGPQGKRGKINTGYFTGPGRVREVKEEEWMLGWSLDGLRFSIYEAQRYILIPSCQWVLDNKSYSLVAKLRKLGSQGDITVYDGVPSDDPADDSPLSPAAILARHCNRTSFEDVLLQ